MNDMIDTLRLAGKVSVVIGDTGVLVKLWPRITSN